MDPIKVVIVGALGRMGRETVKAVHKAPDMKVVGAVARSGAGVDVGEATGIGSIGVVVTSDLEKALTETAPDVMVDFTEPAGLINRIHAAFRAGVRPVIGTTGLSLAEIEDLRPLCHKYGLGAVIAPNFAIGALLMIRFAALAARYFVDAEIIEMHHPAKLDSPSGTAIKTAQEIVEARQRVANTSEGTAARGQVVEKIAGARGGQMGGVHIHSVRLPGLVAHQEVIFGNPSETLTIRHDSLSRESFMPGVLLAIRRVLTLNDVVWGLERLVFTE